jgi:hypothetical protein
MKFEDTGLEGKELPITELDLIMEEEGIDRASWDYKRVVYDYKFVDRHTSTTYYLRIPAVAMEGNIEEHGGDALLRIGEPFIGMHSYPHGVHYDVDFPKSILKSAQRKLKAVRSHLRGE